MIPIDFICINTLEEYKKFLIILSNSSKGVWVTWGQGENFSHVFFYTSYFESCEWVTLKN